MIEKINPKNVSQLANILEFLGEHENYDFYYTLDNTRIYVTDLPSLKRLLKDSVASYVFIEKGDCKGLIIVWKSLGGDKKRYYVKLNAVSPKIAVDLLTVLTWNFNQEMFVKIRKDSPFVNSLKYKSFRFVGGRGVQLLLKRDKPLYEFKTYNKEEDQIDV